MSAEEVDAHAAESDAEEPLPAATGALIGESWCVERTLGRGGTGSVFRCFNRHAPRIHAAIKLLNPKIMDQSEARDRFLKEAEILCTIDHPNVVKVSNVQFDARPPYIEMEFVDGLELKDELGQYGQLPQAVALDRVRQLADALRYLHRKRIYHRDVKPQNILTRKDGTLKLVDFGLAMESGDTGGYGNFGTVSYCPPEWGQSEVDPAGWDLYALGVVLYEMLTGTVAFPVPAHENPQQQLVRVMRDKQSVASIDPGPGVHPDLRAVVRDLTQKNVADRIGDAKELVARLESIDLADWTAPTPRPEGGIVPPTRGSGMPGPVALAGIGGALGVMILVGSMVGIAAAVVLLLAMGVVPMTRNGVVEVTGLAAGIPASVRVADQPPSEVVQGAHHFLRLPVGEVQIDWAVGERCVAPCAGECPVWCVAGKASGDVGVGLGDWTYALDVSAPPPRTVEVLAPAVTAGFARLDGEEAVFREGVATFDAVEPGPYALFAAAGECASGCEGSGCGELCAVTSRSLVVPARGSLPPVRLDLVAPEVEDTDAPLDDAEGEAESADDAGDPGAVEGEAGRDEAEGAPVPAPGDDE